MATHTITVRSFLGDDVTNLLAELVEEYPQIKITLLDSLRLDPSEKNVAKVNNIISKFDPAYLFLSQLDLK